MRWWWRVHCWREESTDEGKSPLLKGRVHCWSEVKSAGRNLYLVVLTGDELIAGGACWRKLGFLRLFGSLLRGHLLLFLRLRYVLIASLLGGPLLLFLRRWWVIIVNPLIHSRCHLSWPLRSSVRPWLPWLPYCFSCRSPFFQVNFVTVYLNLRHPHPKTTPTLERLQQEAYIVDCVDIEWAYKIAIGPADELCMVPIHNLRIVVYIVHECRLCLRDRFYRVATVEEQKDVWKI